MLLHLPVKQIDPDDKMHQTRADKHLAQQKKPLSKPRSITVDNWCVLTLTSEETNSKKRHNVVHERFINSNINVHK